jgi:alkylation response protein AidB-like acyl-CoA dehydrogenase
MTVCEPSRAQPTSYRRRVVDRSGDIGFRSEDLKARTDAIVAISAENAASVDRDARFPEEAITAARAQRLLGIMVPKGIGGEGAMANGVKANYTCHPGMIHLFYGMGNAIPYARTALKCVGAEIGAALG